MPRITPAALVCDRFGGYRRLAQLLGVFPSTTWRWLQDGGIPGTQQQPILQLAERQGVVLSAHEVIYGGEADQASA